MGQCKMLELKLRQEVIYVREEVEVEMKITYRQIDQINKYIKDDENHDTYGQRSKLQV